MFKCWLPRKTDENAKMLFPALAPRPSAAMPILINKKHDQLPVALCVLFSSFCFVLFD